MEKTYPQKVARVFEIVSYVLLAPAALGLFYAALLIVFGISTGDAYPALVGLIPFILAGGGITLLVGYYKRARGRLAEKYIPALWVGTIIYNFLLLLPWLLVALSFLKTSASGRELPMLYLSTVVILGYAAIGFYAYKAYSLEEPVKI